MIDAIIIDDEMHCIERLQNLLGTHCAEKVRLLDVCTDMDEGLQSIHRHNPGLLFLDVQLNGGTGFDLLQNIDLSNIRVIFTTAFEQYAITAFRFSAIDYLLKPVGADELVQSVDKTIHHLAQATAARQYEALFFNLQAGVTAKRICLPTQQGMEFVDTAGIVRCEASGNYTILYLSDAQKIIVSRTMKTFEELLERYGFFRLHHAHLVNLAYVRKYNKGKGGYVVMADGTEIEVATRRKEAFLKRVME